jgi:hypothetical protein
MTQPSPSAATNHRRSRTRVPFADWVGLFRPTLAFALLALGLLAVACGASPEEAPPLSIADCKELGGFPLFDPDDERSVETSCPEGLGFLGEFSEPFFGAEGGICCGGPEAASNGSAD